MRKFLFSILVAVAASFHFLAAGVPAVAQGACKPLAELEQQAKGEPAYVSHAILDAKGAAAVSEIVRAIPGAPDRDWPLVVLVTLKDDSGVILVGENDAICGGVVMSSQAWSALQRAVFGVGA